VLAGTRSTPIKRDDKQRGRQARTPSELPPLAWRDIARRVFDSIQQDRILLVSAGVTFYGLLALFPATAALVSLYGLFADSSTVNDQLAQLSGFLPEGAMEVIADQVKRIVAQGGSSLSFAFAFTLLLSLWGANAGTKALFDALNIIYKEREKRGFIELTIYSLVFTVGGIALLILAAGFVVVVPVLLRTLGISLASWAGVVGLLRWPLLLCAILFGLACLYRYGPSRARPQWRWVTWGSIFAAVIWLSGSLLYSWYVANFGNYNKTYGSLGAVIGFMIWLWLSAIVILVGAEINAEMEHQTAQDTTDGGGRPLGSTGATMADQVGQDRRPDQAEGLVRSGNEEASECRAAMGSMSRIVEI
jgi:membrane protein